ncbi:uncharacterized protein LOC130503474 [Raphanus sativus]|uniref:Uncharacterized protein LOC130503474 n=1 Tax=Raphanus sativus TaxID=3726 RepID=A0A9W3CR31_RAPSA|nr:uncharacterized protein LOC130503474 [Raphanus sativus]
MAENIRCGLQDLTLGADDAPFVLPTNVVRRAEEENRFILIGRPVMPRRQNLRALIATMPRNWGLEGIARGRIIEGRRFQFVFPSEEAMEMVIRRGPWAFAERMMVLQRWTPLMDMALLNYIPFWIQIRGIPFQYMNRDVIVHIAREIGQYIQMDYNEENGGRLEFVRVRINWEVSQPLRFQRNFQFTPGVNTLLRFQYERLRGFCELCGMMTHDNGACQIQNGGPNPDGNNNDSGDDQPDDLVPNQGIIIEEIHDDEVQEEEANPVVPEGDGSERNMAEIDAADDDDELWHGDAMPNMYTDEIVMDEMYNPIDPFGIQAERESGGKRKKWMGETTLNVSKFTRTEVGQSSGTAETKRQRFTVSDKEESAEAQVHDEAEKSFEVRGAVGPEPPLPP